ncbi:hypothetical protein Ndes2526B_g00799 [Nannochloris sp. 'desiccata']|nr:putative Cell division topological specificity factor-like protein, chloroplastic [Chlorella desiccata (nom. nud.)]
MLSSATKLSLASGLSQPLPPRPAQTSQRRAGAVTVGATRSGTEGGAALDPEAVAMLNAARKRIGTRPSSSTAGAAARPSIELSPDADFVAKVKAAWRIFFPEKQRPLSPKEEGKKRLRMILVADRCGMSSDSLAGMRESIVRAMESFVEVESEEAVEVNLSMDPEIGTIYSVAVPVRRVKPSMRPGMDDAAALFDPSDPNADPADQFPYGT